MALSEFVQAGARTNDVKIYNRGYDRARSDTTKQMYWIIQNTQKNKESKSDEPKKFETVQVVLPPRPDGVKRTSDVVTVKMDKTQ